MRPRFPPGARLCRPPPRPLPQHLPDRRLRARGQQDPGGSGPGHRPVPGFLPVLLRGLDQEEPPAHRALQVEHLQQHLGPEPGHHEAPPRWAAAGGTPLGAEFPPRTRPGLSRGPPPSCRKRQLQLEQRGGEEDAALLPVLPQGAAHRGAGRTAPGGAHRQGGRHGDHLGGSKCSRPVPSPPQLGDGCPPGGCSAGRSAAGTSAARGTRAASWRC